MKTYTNIFVKENRCFLAKITGTICDDTTPVVSVVDFLSDRKNSVKVTYKTESCTEIVSSDVFLVIALLVEIDPLSSEGKLIGIPEFLILKDGGIYMISSFDVIALETQQ